jgi:hypothetical protein
MSKKCICSLSQRLVGDGCEVCNPEVTITALKFEINELETELAQSKAMIREWKNLFQPISEVHPGIRCYKFNVVSCSRFDDLVQRAQKVLDR